MAQINQELIRKVLKQREQGGKIYDLDSLVERELREARFFLNAMAGTVYLLEGDNLIFRYTQNDSLDIGRSDFFYSDRSLPISKKSIAGHVALTGEVLNIRDVYAIGENVPYSFNQTFDENANFKCQSILCLPAMNCSNEIVGVLQLINKKYEYGSEGVTYFLEEDEVLARLFSRFIGEAIDRGQTSKREVERLTKVASDFDPKESGAHMQRVTAYGVALLRACFSKKLDYVERDPEKYQGNFRLSAPLHDIGKIGIGVEIVKKNGKLTAEEFEQMKQHTEMGARYIGDQKLPWGEMAVQIALGHHEKWNGKGYPYGKRGEEIPLCARVLAVADVYDALTSKRSYKEAFPHEEACEMIEQESGEHFDPFIIEAFRVVKPTFVEINKQHKE